MTNASSGRRWRKATDLIWTQFDDSTDWVVFNPVAGDIHRMADVAHDLWASVDDIPGDSVQELAAILTRRLGDASADGFAEAATASLLFMDRVGLIRPVSP